MDCLSVSFNLDQTLDQTQTIQPGLAHALQSAGRSVRAGWSSIALHIWRLDGCQLRQWWMGNRILDLMALILQQASLGLFTVQSQEADIVTGSPKGLLDLDLELALGHFQHIPLA